MGARNQSRINGLGRRRRTRSGLLVRGWPTSPACAPNHGCPRIARAPCIDRVLAPRPLDFPCKSSSPWKARSASCATRRIAVARDKDEDAGSRRWQLQSPLGGIVAGGLLSWTPCARRRSEEHFWTNPALAPVVNVRNRRNSLPLHAVRASAPARRTRVPH